MGWLQLAKHRDKVPFEEIYSLIPELWRPIIDNFLSRYEGKSLIQYKSAVAFIVYHTGKQDLSFLNFNDYQSVQAGIKSSQKSYANAFFQYLYSFDVMRIDEGFSSLWSKAALRKEIETKRNKKINKEPNSETTLRRARALSVEEIALLNKLANQPHARELITKYCFIWDMLFYTDCKVTDLQELGRSHYKDHLLIASNGDKIKIPE